MRHQICYLLALFIACGFNATSAFAADDESILYEYTPAGWGFSLGLTDTGKTYDAGDPTWAADADLDFSWMSSIDDPKIAPIYRIDGKTIRLLGDDGTEKVMTDEGFADYYDYMVDAWSSSETTTLLGSEPDYEGADGRLWHMFHLHEESASAGPLDYYMLLGRDDDDMLRQISFYYTPPETADEDDAILGMVMIHLDPSLMEEE
jgi:hypothetical protein